MLRSGLLESLSQNGYQKCFSSSTDPSQLDSDSPKSRFSNHSKGSNDNFTLRAKHHMCKSIMTLTKCQDEDTCDAAHDLTQLLKNTQIQNTLKLKPCPSFFNHMGCLDGVNCLYSHQDTTFKEIIKHKRRGNKFNLLNDYPQIIILQGRTSSLLFE